MAPLALDTSINNYFRHKEEYKQALERRDFAEAAKALADINWCRPRGSCSGGIGWV